jgi:hypothetical protein
MNPSTTSVAVTRFKKYFHDKKNQPLGEHPLNTCIYSDQIIFNIKFEQLSYVIWVHHPFGCTSLPIQKSFTLCVSEMDASIGVIIGWMY